MAPDASIGGSEAEKQYPRPDNLCKNTNYTYISILHKPQ